MVCRVLFSIRKIQKSDIVCNIVDMDVCHLLLGRYWQFDVNAVHSGRDKMSDSQQNSKKVSLVPLMNKKKKSKDKKKIFLTIFKSCLKDDCNSYKKLENEDEFKVNIIPNEVQSLYYAIKNARQATVFTRYIALYKLNSLCELT